MSIGNFTNSKIDNITVNYSCLKAVDYSKGSSAAVYFNGTQTTKPVTIDNLTINITGTANAHRGPAIAIDGNQGVILRSPRINAPTDATYSGAGIWVNGKDSQIIDLRTTGNIGSVYFDANSSGNLIEAKGYSHLYQSTGVDDIYGTGTNSPILFAAGSKDNKVLLANATLNCSGNQVYSYGTNNKVLLNFTNFRDNSVTVDPSKRQADFEIYSGNHNGVVGTWKYQNRLGTFQTSEVTRSLGTNYSLLVQMSEQALSQSRRHFVLSPKGRETIYANLYAGQNVIRLYGAYKGVIPMTTKHIGFSFDWFDNLYNFHIVNTLQEVEATLTSDGSTWNGDINLTQFVIEATIIGALQQSCPMNIYISPEYDATGYLYIDPTPIITVN
jgi:hypothetical protein